MRTSADGSACCGESTRRTGRVESTKENGVATGLDRWRSARPAGGRVQASDKCDGEARGRPLGTREDVRVGRADKVANAKCEEGSPAARGSRGWLLDRSPFRRERARRQPHSGASARRNDAPAWPAGHSPSERDGGACPAGDLTSKMTVQMVAHLGSARKMCKHEAQKPKRGADFETNGQLQAL
jgi:hypothetical protein